MSDATQIALIKTQTLALIVSMTANPKPSYSVDGQTVSWGAYLKQLQETVAWCDVQLTSTEGPFEEVTQYL